MPIRSTSRSTWLVATAEARAATTGCTRSHSATRSCSTRLGRASKFPSYSERHDAIPEAPLSRVRCLRVRRAHHAAASRAAREPPRLDHALPGDRGREGAEAGQREAARALRSRLGLREHRVPRECDVLRLQAVSYTHLRAHETGRNLVCR